MVDKVLIVDDDQTSLIMLSQILKRMGCEVKTANDGPAALRLIQNEEFTAVLLDILMPKMTGMEVLLKVRESYENAELPIVMVTSNDSDKDVIEALGAGANDYLVKPINVEIAIARIKCQLDLSRFYKTSLRLTQMETLQAMITTYNHEINNPLASAMGFLDMEIRNNESQKLKKAQASLNKIQAIVVKIRELAEHDVEFTDYAGGTKILKVVQ